MLSIFGIGVSKFQGTGTPDKNIIILDNSITQADYLQPRDFRKQSSLTGKWNYKNLGDYATFEVLVYLFKYASPKNTMTDLYSYLHQFVTFYPHKDGAVSGDGKGEPMSYLKSGISGITNANPAKVTTSGAHGLKTGDLVKIDYVSGMTEVNGTSFTVTVIDSTNFTLDGIDSTSYGAYTSGGIDWGITKYYFANIKHFYLDNIKQNMDVVRLEFIPENYIRGDKTIV